MKIINLCMCTLALPFIHACSTTPIHMEDTKFLTRINSNGLKHFELQFYKKPEPIELGQPQKQNTRPKRVSPKRIKRNLHDLAQSHIEQNRFCRDGFWTISTEVLAPVLRLRGECNEAATDEDRAAFPNTIKEW